ncbi:MAG: hypothetical protein HY889_01055 [Deltaproteobacteria bacterium]|nr:hypothetical protein [Deltaproteobacteria bacterium]
MKLSLLIGSVLVAFALMVSTSQAAVQPMGLEGYSKGVLSHNGKNGTVTILNTDPYMGLYDYALGVPSQRDKASIPEEALGVTAKEDSTYMGLKAYEEGVPTQNEMSIDEEQAVYYAGALTSVNPDGTLMVKLSVPGPSGPAYWDVPFKITKDTTMTICYRSIASCDSSGNALKELNTLAELENLSAFNEAKKDVVIVNNTETGEVVHVEIEYNL